MNRISRAHDRLTVLADCLRLPVMDTGWGEQVQAGVVMNLVVPVKEGTHSHAGILDRAETVGIAGVVLEGLELGLGERVVIGGIRTAGAGTHAEVVQQQQPPQRQALLRPSQSFNRRRPKQP